MIIQDIWLRDRNLKNVELLKTWDMPVAEDLKKRFLAWYEDLNNIPSFVVPR